MLSVQTNEKIAFYYSREYNAKFVYPLCKVLLLNDKYSLFGVIQAAKIDQITLRST